jgi:hypothetical protein
MTQPLKSDKQFSLWPLGILGILISWFAYQAKTPRREDATCDASGPSKKIPAPLADTAPPPPKTAEPETTFRPDQTPWWRTFGEGIALLGGIGLLIVNIYQLSAAQSAANTAASALHIDQRAWLSAWMTNDPYKEEELMHLTVHIRNSGHTFAKNSTINRNVAIVSKGAEPRSDDWKNDLTVTAGLIPPGIGETWTHEIHSSEKLDKTLSDALKDGTKIIYVRGRIDFDDIFPDSHRHWVSFCFHSSSGTNWLTCNTGNDIDPY